MQVLKENDVVLVEDNGSNEVFVTIQGVVIRITPSKTCDSMNISVHGDGCLIPTSINGLSAIHARNIG